MATENRIVYYKVLHDISYRGRRYKKGRVVRFQPKNARKFVEQGKLLASPSPRFTDIMKAGLRLPERVIILGSGPRGVEHYDRLPSDAFIIALNMAVLAPVQSAIWMAMDPSLKDQKWFMDQMVRVRREDRDLRMSMIGKSDYPIPLVDQRRVAKYFPWVRCVFKLLRPSMMAPRDVEPAKDHIRPGCTVAGAAVQVCFHCGVRRIEFCGVDMFGNRYFDGSKHKQKDRKGEPWGPVRRFNELMRCLEGKGMEFASWSETQLNVPVMGKE